MDNLTQTPFTLQCITNQDIAYKNWRTKKLQNTPDYSQYDLNKLFIDIEDARSPTTNELQKISNACVNNSFCLYRIKNKTSDSKKNIHALAKHIGLSHLDNNICADEDSLTSITNTSHQGQHEYIPYSTKRLSWHTDGYYNKPENNINAMLLHCAQPAKKGGESLLMDHEIAYLLLRDENPAYIEALMQADAMTIPANILNGEVIREAQTGPVFSTNNAGQLHMRYSARKRNIEWKQTDTTLEAVNFLEELLENNSKHVIRYALQAAEGLICRNILHRRTAFVDFDEESKKRLLYRGRYFDELTHHNYKTPKNRGDGL
ncbi:MAG: TauD/TfdA family dioxygenase [Thiotrichaceae bacterium]|nr:TauD/TfdA family dioxygenase [Thiotrichaceae bacterium]